MDEKKKPSPNQGNQLNIELPAEIAHGVYSNLAIISHSPTEFILDFIQVLPGAPKAQVRSRIILAPQHAKRLFLALGDNLEKFEQNHGSIEGDMPQGSLPPNFGGPAGYA